MLGIVNGFVRPIVTLLTLPLTIITLGIFLLVVNGLMVLLVSWVVDRFHGHMHIGGLLNAIFVTIVIWLVSLVANIFIGGDERRAPLTVRREALCSPRGRAAGCRSCEVLERGRRPEAERRTRRKRQWPCPQTTEKPSYLGL